jgi:predicted ATP-grasp superfamily ATP-dependent carboligase
MSVVEIKAKVFDKLVVLEQLNQQAQAIQKEIQELNEELKKALEAEKSQAE